MFQLDKSGMIFFSKDDFDSQNVILKNECLINQPPISRTRTLLTHLSLLMSASLLLFPCLPSRGNHCLQFS